MFLHFLTRDILVDGEGEGLIIIRGGENGVVLAIKLCDAVSEILIYGGAETNFQIFF